MTIEETYKGMWSSDATLLKSLLDAGETIIAVSGMGYGRAFFYDCDYVFQVGDDMHYIEKRMDELLFLIPPRPLVLEPKPLEWKVSIDDIDEDGEGAYCHDGDWSFIIAQDQSWEIYFMDEVVATDCGHQIEAKAAIHEWRTNHLKSMLP